MSPPPSKRQSNTMTTETNPVKFETRPWSDLPPELLSPIANDLGIIELLSFRGTCKDWLAASSTASAQVESSPDRKPWLLLCDGENSQCLLYDDSSQKKYSLNIPELEESTCLSSYQGWLLLFKKGGSMFFFCPFSRAKIDLPNFPHEEISDHIATLSSPPTAKDCIVCVMNRQDKQKVELNFFRRGEEKWTKVDHHCSQYEVDVVAGATYDDGIFYFMGRNKKALTYSVEQKKWVVYRILTTSDPSYDYLPFSYMNNYFKNGGLKSSMELEENVSISTCGTTLPGHSYDTLINNETIEGSKEGENKLLKGIWIQPRFHQIPPSHTWSL